MREIKVIVIIYFIYYSLRPNMNLSAVNVDIVIIHATLHTT